MAEWRRRIMGEKLMNGERRKGKGGSKKKMKKKDGKGLQD